MQRETSSSSALIPVRNYFNPLPLCRGRPNLMDFWLMKLIFQSSPSMQRETGWSVTSLTPETISILSLYAEGDNSSFNSSDILNIFQSSPSMQRETWGFWWLSRLWGISILSLYAEGDFDDYDYYEDFFISILSLYAEGDHSWQFVFSWFYYFNPLPLCRGRPSAMRPLPNNALFQSSPSMQRETIPAVQTFYKCDISILSLYAEGDLSSLLLVTRIGLFQSSPSMQRET